MLFSIVDHFPQFAFHHPSEGFQKLASRDATLLLKSPWKLVLDVYAMDAAVPIDALAFIAMFKSVDHP
jgi:hypothetical protein